MPSKEEIANMKKYFNECILKDTVYEEDLTLNYIKIAREYIKQLETKEKKLIEKLEEKDKIIDLMAEELDTSDYCVPGDCPGIDCKEHVKEYYRKMAKEGNNE